MMDKVNLLPWREAEAMRWRRCWSGQLAGLLALLLCCTLLPASYFYYETGRWNLVQQQLMQERQRIQQQVIQHRQWQQQQWEKGKWLNRAQRLQRQNRARIHRLRHLSDLLPADLWLRLIRDKRDTENGAEDVRGVWYLQGLSHNHASIMAFMQRLQSQPRLQKVHLDLVTMTATDPLLRFQIIAYWQESDDLP